MWTSFALLIVKLAPTILSMIETALNTAHDQQQLDAGDAKAVADALISASKARALASQIDDEASRAHANDASDNAFDPAFRGKD